MNRFDCMYLISKEKYESLKNAKSEGAIDTSGANDGSIGGNARESQVNNFDVSHGGTVVIGEKSEEKNIKSHAGLYPPSNKVESAKSGSSKKTGDKSVNYADKYEEKGLDFARRRMRELTATSQKLKDARKTGVGSKVSSPGKRGRGVFSNFSPKKEKVFAPRQAKLVEKLMLDRLMEDRVDQLSGGKKRRRSLEEGKAGKAARIRLGSGDIDRRIIHDLRENHKNELKRTAARKYLGAMHPQYDIEMAYNPVTPEEIEMRELSKPVAGKKRGHDDILLPQPPSKSLAWRVPPRKLSKRKKTFGKESEEDSDEEPPAKRERPTLPWSGYKRGVQEAFPDASSNRRKKLRVATRSDSEEEDDT